jgi:hypothetical protein
MQMLNLKMNQTLRIIMLQMVMGELYKMDFHQEENRFMRKNKRAILFEAISTIAE